MLTVNFFSYKFVFISAIIVFDSTLEFEAEKIWRGSKIDAGKQHDSGPLLTGGGGETKCVTC